VRGKRVLGLAVATTFASTVGCRESVLLGERKGAGDAANAETAAEAVDGTDPPAAVSQLLKVGAGGFVTGIDIDPTGATYLLRTDNYGGYIGNGSDAWQQVVRVDAMPMSFLASFTQGTAQGLGEGVYEIRVAPSDPKTIYMVYGSRVYKTTNRAVSWTPLVSFPNVGRLDPNDDYRAWGEKEAVDPGNADIVYVGTVRSGLFVSADGGTSWSRVAQVPVASHPAGTTGIVFDATSGATNGKTNVIYACSNGKGVYRSADAGATWVLQNGGPIQISHAAVAKDGAYYAASSEDGRVYRFGNGKWTATDSGLGTAFSIAPDPSNPARIVAGTGSGHIAISTDRGASWDGVLWSQRIGAGDVPNLALTSSSYMSTGQHVFDPVAPNKLWLSAGYGVYFAENTRLAPSDTVTWQVRSAGIEAICARDIAVPPASTHVLLAGENRGVWVLPRANTSYPGSNVTLGSNANQVLAYAVDHSHANSQHLVALVNRGNVGEPELSGYSLDDGTTWTVFPVQPGSGGQGGDIVAPSIDNIIAVIGAKYAYRSVDRGASWKPLSLPGDAGNDTDNLHCGYNCRRHILAVDGQDRDTVYLYFYTHGLYRSTNAGATWTLVSSSDFDGGTMYWHAKLRSVPGQAGHLFLTTGPAGGADSANPEESTHLWRSVDGGATWTAVPGFAEPYDVALGKAAPGQSYPAIYVVGWYSGSYGIWRSTDATVTFVSTGTFPCNSVATINVIAASPDVYGELYFAFQGSGWGNLVQGEP
jgi:hypothetical protein